MGGVHPVGLGGVRGRPVGLGGIHSLVLVEIHPLVLSGDPWLSHGSL